jgi:hypothetical protein
MANCDITQLMADGKCFTCLEPKQMQAVLLQLVCELQTGMTELITEINTLIAATGGPTASDLVYATPMTLDLDGADYQTVALTGNINFSATSNRPALGLAKAIAVIIEADGSIRTLTFNANWTFVGTLPADIQANKVGVLSVTAVGPNETDVICAYQEEA